MASVSGEEVQQAQNDNIVRTFKQVSVPIKKVARGTPAEARLRKDNRLPQPETIGTNKTNSTDFIKPQKLRRPKPSKSNKESKNASGNQWIWFLLFISILLAFTAYYSSLTSTIESSKFYEFFGSTSIPEFPQNKPPQKVLKEMIQQQYADINQRINEYLESQISKSHEKLSHETQQELHKLNCEIRRLATRSRTVPSMEELNNVNDQMKKLVSRLQIDTDQQRTSLQQEIYDIHTELNNFNNKAERLRAEINKHNAFEEKISVLSNQGNDLRGRTNTIEDKIAEIQNRISASNSLHDARFLDLEARVANLEKNYMTKQEMNQKISEIMKQYESIQPLTVMDVNSLVREYLQENKYKPYDEGSMFELVRRYIEMYGVSLNQLENGDYVALRDQISSYVLQEMRKMYYEDDIGKPDYALGAVGGKIVDYTGKWAINNLLETLLPFGEKPHPPSIVLEGFKQVGDCWAFHGAKAFLSIRLSSKIYPESISLEHIASSIAHTPNLTSAPREFRVLGFAEAGAPPILLGTFEYDRNGPQVQNFLVDEHARNQLISLVKVEFVSNYGHSYTCVYRVRVHGTPANIQKS